MFLLTLPISVDAIAIILCFFVRRREEAAGRKLKEKLATRRLKFLAVNPKTDIDFPLAIWLIKSESFTFCKMLY
jgi:hypothetical protein